jgi:hypothetical protein
LSASVTMRTRPSRSETKSSAQPWRRGSHVTPKLLPGSVRSAPSRSANVWIGWMESVSAPWSAAALRAPSESAPLMCSTFLPTSGMPEAAR